MKRRVILLTAFYLILIPTITLASFDVNSKEFKRVIAQLDMQGHADHEFSTCSIQHVYYDEVTEMLNEGKSEKEIISYYVDQYGQAALREPDTKGSGIIAWGMPAFGFLFGAIVVAFGLKKLTANGVDTVEKRGTSSLNLTEIEKSVLEKTIEKERRKLF